MKKQEIFSPVKKKYKDERGKKEKKEKKQREKGEQI